MLRPFARFADMSFKVVFGFKRVLAFFALDGQLLLGACGLMVAVGQGRDQLSPMILFKSQFSMIHDLTSAIFSKGVFIIS